MSITVQEGPVIGSLQAECSACNWIGQLLSNEFYANFEAAGHEVSERHQQAGGQPSGAPEVGERG